MGSLTGFLNKKAVSSGRIIQCPTVNMQNARIAEKSHSVTVKLKKNLAIGIMEPFHSRGAGNAEQLKEEKKNCGYTLCSMAR